MTRQSVAFSGQGEREKALPSIMRAPPRVQLKVVVVVNQQYPPTKVTNVALATV